jgi:hypothetical protein
LLGSQVNYIAFQNGPHLHPPGFAAGQGAALGDGPEPQGAPVVHDQFQAAVGRGQVAIGIEQALAADGFFLGAADRVKFICFCYRLNSYLRSVLEELEGRFNL